VIHVDRKRVEAPAILSGPEAQQSLADAKEHFAASDAQSEQKGFRFNEVYAKREVMKALAELFYGKCAFCESSVGASAAPIRHHFRPKQDAVDDQGDVSRPHYWWLAYEWDNIYFTCQRCATSAGARFPVRGERAPIGSTGAALENEARLLIDPCRDRPEQHLLFADDGIVAARSESAEATIDTYNLNRDDLVHLRHQAMDTAEKLALARDLSKDLVAELLAPDNPYLGAVRQKLVRLADELKTILPDSITDLAPEEVAREVEAITSKERARSVETIEVQELEIRNFKAIEHIRLEFPPPGKEGHWAMLLGENGAGKTSILQALALTLMGDKARENAVSDVTDLVRDGADAASIYVRSGPRSRTLHIDGSGFTVEGDDSPAPIAAYGAGRVPSGRHRSTRPKRSPDRPPVDSLFDSHTELTPAARWLADLDDRQFNFAARAIKQLVLEPDETVLERGGEEVFLVRARGKRSINSLSDGYRAMIALAADLMSFFFTRVDAMEAARGIVVIDEIGAHLHPRWQMQIVKAFRRAFPHLQVIATTHDPLCLRGMEDGEVMVLRSDETGRRYALPSDEVPSVKGLRVDELLTSEVFGLSSTIDPDVERLFEEYYALLAIHDRSTAVEEEIARLRDELDAYRQLGSTRRERLVFEAADAYLAREEEQSDPAEREEVSEEMKERLRRIWAGEVA
jgi:uncharacterized protein (TIGR02646 family)